MIELSSVYTYGWEAAIRGMRNPLNSWSKIDSFTWDAHNPQLGPSDLALMKRLVSAGTDHSKFMRMITVSMDIEAPLYWWKEFDTYKVGTVANSCSTMHRIHACSLTLKDFSCEHLNKKSLDALSKLIQWLNECRYNFTETKDKEEWWQLIQLLPSSYNQKRTVFVNYAVLRRMYHARKNHKLDEWRDFCQFISTLPYAQDLIIGNGPDANT